MDDVPDAPVGGNDLEEDQVVKEAGSGIDSKDGADEADGSDVAVNEAEAVFGDGEPRLRRTQKKRPRKRRTLGKPLGKTLRQRTMQTKRIPSNRECHMQPPSRSRWKGVMLIPATTLPLGGEATASGRLQMQALSTRAMAPQLPLCR